MIVRGVSISKNDGFNDNIIRGVDINLNVVMELIKRCGVYIYKLNER